MSTTEIHMIEMKSEY